MVQAILTEKNNLPLSIFAIILGVFFASLSDAFIKFISADFQLWQIFVLRSAVTMPILIIIIKARTSFQPLIPQQIAWVAVRSLLLVFMWVTYYIALPHIDLSIAAAVYYTLPLFITLFAAMFAGEKVNVKAWGAIVLGCVGMLLILKPQADDFNRYALLPLASAIFYALAMVLTRTKIQGESATVLSLSLNFAFMVVGIIGSCLVALLAKDTVDVDDNAFIVGSWTDMDFQAWLAIAVLALLITAGSQLATIAYQYGPSSIVSAFDFFYLAFIVMWGLLFFAEVPDVVTVLGILLIAIAGVVIVKKQS